MHRFYCKETFQEKNYTLDPIESHHLHHVLRLEKETEITLFNGEGLLSTARILISHAKKTQVEIIKTEQLPRQNSIELAFGVSKPQAMEFLFKRVTELGIKAFHPLITQHSQSASSWNSERWNRLLIEVCKQCEDPYLPTLHSPIKMETWLGAREKEDQIFFCDENRRNALSPITKSESTFLLVGSEGGWSETERQQVQKRGVTSLSLGKNRLRVEMACIVGTVLLKTKLGEI